MANFARVIDGRAVDVSSSPSNHFHPNIAEQFEQVPDDVLPGWILSGGEWAAPVVDDPQPIEVPPIQVSPVQFKLLFTPQERVALKAARAGDPMLDDFFSIVDDPRLSHVDLSLASTIAAVGYLVSLGLLTQQRADVILTGGAG